MVWGPPTFPLHYCITNFTSHPTILVAEKPSQDDQVSVWLDHLRAGDSRAPELIFQRYFEKLVRLARRRLGQMPRRVADEEDVAISAIQSLFRGVDAGRYPQLHDRDDLWKLLVTITARKAMRQQRRHFAAKRGGGQVVGESGFGDEGDGDGIAQVLGHEPTPELLEQIHETCRELLAQLEDESLERIVLLKLEGYTNDEIAEQLDCVTRTVERKLGRIRDKWCRETT